MRKTLSFLILVGCLSTGQVFAFSTFVVQKIEVEGLKRISPDAVLQAANIKLGSKISENQADELIHALYKTQFFKDVALFQHDHTLVIKVIERPTVGILNLTGIKDKDKILKVLKEINLVEGRVFDPALLNRAVKHLEQYYLGRGRYGVKIEAKVSELPQNRVKVDLSIFEGDLASIQKIKVIGNHVFSEATLLKELHLTKKGVFSWFTHDDQYSKEKLNADMEIMRSYYMDRGYINFQINSSQVSLSPDKKYIYITFNVSEGDLFKVGSLDISGDFVVPREELLPLLKPIKSNQSFSRKTLLEVKEALEERLGSEGYSLAEVRPNTDIDESKKIINLDFHIVPSRRVYVRKINITGNQTTQDEVIRRELPQMEGSWISTNAIKEGKRNLLRRGFAAQVDVDTVGVPGSPDQMDLDYSIEEARIREFSASVGYSPTEKFMFRLGLAQQNFLGTGKTIDFVFDKSKAFQTYSLGFVEPFFTLDGIGFGANAYYSKSDLGNATFVSDYQTDSVGSNLNWVLPISKHENLRFGFGYDYTVLKIGSNNAQEILEFVNGVGNTPGKGTKFVEYSATAGWGYDTLDAFIFPREGISHALNAKATLPGAKLEYYRVTYDGAWYYPIKGDYILNLSANCGFGDGYGKTDRMPFFKNFFGGGIGSIRGYKPNSLGPKDSRNYPFGGNALVAGTVNFIFPNPIKPEAKSIRTSLFFDVGKVYDTRDKFRVINGVRQNRNSAGLRYAVGVSIQWHTPLGAPLILSLAQPLNLRTGDARRRFAFMFGTQM